MQHEIAQRVAKLYEPKVEAAQKKGGRPRGAKNTPKKGRETSPTLKTKQDETKRTGEVAAKVAGVSRRTLEKTKAVMEFGDKELIAEMDRTGHSRRIPPQPSPRGRQGDTTNKGILKSC